MSEYPDVRRYDRGDEADMYWIQVRKIKELLKYIEPMVDCVGMDLIRDMHDDVKKMKDKYIGDDIPMYRSHYIDSSIEEGKPGHSITEEEYLKRRDEKYGNKK